MFTKKIITLVMTAMISTTMLYAQEDEPKEKKPAVRTAVMEDGKLFVIDENGEKQEVDTSNARSITVQQSNKMVDQDGERTQVSGGKAVLIGPDGETTVFEFDGDQVEMPNFDIRILGLDDGMAGGEAGGEIIPFPRRPAIVMPEIRGMMGGVPRGIGAPRGFSVNRGEAGKFMIGVHCRPSSPAIRSQLELENIGLTIESIVPSSPADDAELQQYDILLFANDQQLASQSDLTKAVELAGEEGTPIAVTFLRAGTEKTTELTPKERPAGQGDVRAVFPGGFEAAMPGFEFRDLGPGIILEPDARFDEAFKDIRAEMEKMQQDMKAQMQEMRDRQQKMMERDR